MKKDVSRLTLTALFVALVLLFGLTPVGLIPLGFINVTILCIPVLIGTIVLGLKSGLLLGAFFGLVSMMSVLGFSMTPPSGLAGALLAKSPVLTAVMCFVPRLLVPVVCFVVYRLLTKGGRWEKRALPVAAAAGSLTNTLLYLSMMYIFYRVVGLDATAIVALLTGTGLIAGSCEAIAAAVIVSPVVIALNKVQHRTQEK